MKIVVSFLFLFSLFLEGYATDYISNGNGTAWGTASNWTPNGVPASGDNVTIAAGHTIIMGTSRTVSNLYIASTATLSRGTNVLTVTGNNFSNYGTLTGTGGITFSTNSKTIDGNGAWGATDNYTIVFNVSATINSNVNISKRGNIQVNNSSTVTNNGSVTISTTGTLTTSNNGTWTNAANSFLQVVGAIATNITFNASASGNTVKYIGGNYTIKSPSSSTYHHLSVSSGTKTFPGALTVNGNLDVANTTTLSIGANNLTLGGNLTLNSSGVISITTNTCTFNNNTTLSGGAANAFDFNNVTISGTLTAISANMNVGGNFTNNGTFNHNSGTVTFDGTTTISGSSTTSFNNIVISGTLTASSGTMNVAGNFTNNGTFNHNNGTVGFNGTTAMTGSGSFSFRNINISGSLTAPSGTLNVAGNFTNNGTYNHNNGTINFNGTTTIAGSNPPAFHHVIVSNTLTSSSNAIEIKGNFTQNGTFNHNNGDVSFTGTSGQTIGGTASEITFYNLILDNPVSVTANPQLDIVSSVTIADGTFITNDTVTLISDASNTAYIGNSLNGSLNVAGGAWKIQRYISASTANWNDLTTSLNGTANISDWDDDLYLSIGILCPDGVVSGWYSVYDWDESSQSWSPVTNCAEPLPKTKGFELWLATNSSSFSATTMDSEGVPALGDVPTSLAANADEWSLIGNPYACTIDWSLVFADATNLYNYFAIYDETINDYAEWDGDAFSGTGQLASSNGLIGAHQGFWVVNSMGGSSLTFSENHKSPSNTPLVRKKPRTENILKMQLYKEGMKNRCEAVIKIDDDGTEYMTSKDFPYMKSRDPLTPSLTPLTVDNKRVRRKSIPVKSYYSLPLIATFGVPGEYQIDFAGVSLITKYETIVLEDVETGAEFLIETDKTYRFKHEDITKERKFVLHFYKSRKSTTTAVEIPVHAYNADEGISLSFGFEELTDIQVAIFNSIGQRVVTKNLKVRKESVIIPMEKANQIYIIQVSSDKGTVTKKICL